jgi:hypothetical protein
MRQSTLQPAKKKTASRSPDPLVGMSDRRLLEMRVCDLSLKLKESWLEPMVEQLYGELARRGLRIRPHCWLSDEWYSPDGIPGIAIPFYLAHPRLMRLEKKQMFEVEGGNKSWCMRILRHEAGHAIDTAFRLHRRKNYKSVFGNYFEPYPDHYRPKPQSKSYVMHLEPWYSQAHPAEDFAETFAVWLNPKSNWKRQYKGWDAIKKLEFVDELMQQIAGQTAPVRCRQTIDPASRLKLTLREYYEQRHARFDFDCPTTFESDLKKLFGLGPTKGTTLTAATFLQRNRLEMCRVVSEWTGEYRYNINLVLRAMIEHCRELGLYANGSLEKLRYSATVMLTVHANNYLHGGHHRVSL